MDALNALHCELKIMNAKNIQATNSDGYLFVRCYISAGNNKRVRVDTREVSPNGKVDWNESFSLDCIGMKQSIDMIFNRTIVLELRWRGNSVSLFGRSQLIGRTEVSWRGVFESPNMEMERWVEMKSKRDAKVPSVCISMKIQASSGCGAGLVERKRKNKWDENCGCCQGDCSNNICVDSEIFAIGAALDAF